MKSIPSLFAILISSLVISTQTDAAIEYAESSGKGLRPSWLTDSHRNRIELFKKWLENKPIGNSGHSPATPYDILHPTHQFKGACYCYLFSSWDNFQFSDKTKCKLSLENKNHD
jgi:hypothetical protein